MNVSINSARQHKLDKRSVQPPREWTMMGLLRPSQIGMDGGGQSTTISVLEFSAKKGSGRREVGGEKWVVRRGW